MPGEEGGTGRDPVMWRIPFAMIKNEGPKLRTRNEELAAMPCELTGQCKSFEGHPNCWACAPCRARLDEGPSDADQ